MSMHNPPHPGEFINEIYMKPFELSSRQVSANLNVSHSTLTRLIRGDSSITPEMALRLSTVFGRSPESWLTMQDNYSLWIAKQNIDLSSVKKLELTIA